MKSLRALHIASFNGNIGDNANHNGFRSKLECSLGSPIQYRELEIREFYQSWNIRDFNSRDFVSLCNNFDFVVIGGGNFFELKWDYSCTGTTINISTDTLNQIKVPIFFNALGCDVAKGASQSAISKFESFLDVITSSDKYMVSIRNDGSYKTLNDLYGNKYNESIYRVPDGGFFFKTKPFYYPELNPKYKSLGINIVSDMKKVRFSKQQIEGIEYEEFIESFARVINNFFYAYEGYQIILFPHIYSDLEAIYKLLERIDDRFRRKRVVVAPYLTGEGADEYIFGLYKQCEVILGMRFHSNVCSIAQQIPTIALSSYKKIVDLYDELQLSDRVVEVNKRGFDNKLQNQIEFTLKNIEDVKKRYGIVNANLLIKGKAFYDEVKKWCMKNDII